MQGFLFEVMAVAPDHMPKLSVTLPNFVFQDVKSLLNAVALANINLMLVTLDTSQVPMSLLKALAV